MRGSTGFPKVRSDMLLNRRIIVPEAETDLFRFHSGDVLIDIKLHVDGALSTKKQS
jgi:hypothetical protein